MMERANEDKVVKSKRSMLRLRKSCSNLGRSALRLVDSATHRGRHSILRKLNSDILYRVAELLDFRSKLRFMHTCRELYNLVLPCILRHVEYRRFSDRERLYQLLLAVNPARFMSVTHLTFIYARKDFDLDDHYGDFFLDFLRLAFSLELLDITLPVGVPIDDELIFHIGSLQHLRHLRLRGHMAYASILEAITTPLKSLLIEEKSSKDLLPYRDSLRPIPNPVLPSSAPFYSSLEDVGLEFLSPTQADMPAAFLPRECVFPAARKVSWRSWTSVDPGTLASLFPHAEELSLRFHGLPNLEDFQRQQLLRQHRSARQWPAPHRMKALRGDPASLWLAGIRVPVEHLDFDMHGRHASQDLHPAVLHDWIVDVGAPSITVRFFAGNHALATAELRNLLHGRLRELHIVLLMHRTQGVDAVASLIPFLERRSSQRALAEQWMLPSVVITFEEVACSWDCCGRRPPGKWHAQVKWDAFARFIFAVLPSVRTIRFHFTHLPSLTWRRETVLPEGSGEGLFPRRLRLDEIAALLIVR